ncbi:hypothetical protein Tco_0889833, partial [Tanacetum coccineum]
LKHQGYIREEPLKKWKKNGELCKLDIMNPDITIEDQPLKHMTPAMEDSFKKHVDSLLKIGAIRPRFHQVAMDEESIPWTAFLVPGGLYEWLVMPFGLKTPQQYSKERWIFQRKMDKCFRGTESFNAVYINDILVFSKNEKEHAKHLERMLKIYKDNGLVQNLLDFEIPPENAYIILETDGCMEGWGGIVKWKKSKGDPRIPQCLLEEYEDHLRRSHEDFQPLPRIFTKTIFTPEEPGALYKRYQLKANQTPIRMDKSDAWRSVA